MESLAVETRSKGLGEAQATFRLAQQEPLSLFLKRRGPENVRLSSSPEVVCKSGDNIIISETALALESVAALPNLCGEPGKRVRRQIANERARREGRIAERLGKLPLAAVERRHVMALHESLCETPAMPSRQAPGSCEASPTS